MMTVDEFISKYLGKHYGTGASTCFRFAKDVYEKELEMTVLNDYLEMLNDFRIVKEPQFLDLVVIKNHPLIVNHLGIYLREGRFAHCGAGAGRDEVFISSVLDFPWSKRTVGFLRHKNR